MFLGLANASIRKMLTYFLLKVVAFVKQNHSLGEHSFYGFILLWSERFSLLIHEIDHLYDDIYKLDLNIPMRYEIPKYDHLYNSFKTDKIAFLHDCIQFVKNTDKYLQIYDYIFLNVLQYTNYFDKEGSMFKNASDVLKGHVLDIVGSKKMKSFLKKNIDESDLIIDIFYKPLALIGPQFYKN